MTAMPANVASTLTVATDANQTSKPAGTSGKTSQARWLPSGSETGVMPVGAKPSAVTDFKSHLDGVTKSKSQGNSPEAGASAKKRSRSEKALKLSSSGEPKGNPVVAGTATEVSASTSAAPSRDATRGAAAQPVSSQTTPLAATAATDPASNGTRAASMTATVSKGTSQTTSAMDLAPQILGTAPQSPSPSVSGARSVSPRTPTSPPPVSSVVPSESPTAAAGQVLRGPTPARGGVQGGEGLKRDVASAPQQTVRTVALQTGSAELAQSPARVQSSSGLPSGGLGIAAVPSTSAQAHPAPAPVSASVSVQASPGSTAVSSQSQQMLSVLSPVLNRPNGTHQISIEMHPADLGTIQATVTVQSGHVTVELHADHPGARQVLGTALPDLRQQLGSGGRHADVFLAGGTKGRIPGSPSQSSLATQSGAARSSLLVTSQGVNARTSVDLRL